MYDVSQSLYNETVVDFVQKVKGVFILSGAFCHADTSDNSAPIPPGTVPAVVNANGFQYANSVSSIQLPSIGTVTDDNLIINFTFFKKYDKSLTEDVTGKIYKENDRYYLYIDNKTVILDFIGHDNLLLRLTDIAPFTVEKLRKILSNVRAMMGLNLLDKLHDVLPIPSTKQEQDDLLAKMKEYINHFIDDSFLFNICVKSSTSTTDKIVLNLAIHKPDSSKATKDLIKIELFARNYEPAIVLTTNFENDTDSFGGTFVFLEPTVQPFKVSKMLSAEESSYIIKGLMRIVSELDTYRYVIID